MSRATLNSGLQLFILREQQHKSIFFETTQFRGLLVEAIKTECHNWMKEEEKGKLEGKQRIEEDSINYICCYWFET